MVIGHRGLGRDSAPITENTIPALVSALRAGATAVEFDVQLSADGEVVLAHDPDLSRVSRLRGCVASQTSSALATAGDGRLFPTLRDALEAIRPYDQAARPFLADIHIKVFDGVRGDWASGQARCPKTDYKALARQVVKIVEEKKLTSRVLLTSFDTRVLDLIQDEAPLFQVGLLSFLYATRAIETAGGKYDAVIVNNETASPGDLALARLLGLRVFFWFPTQEFSEADYCALAHVDGIITDHLDDSLQMRATLQRGQWPRRSCLYRSQVGDEIHSVF